MKRKPGSNISASVVAGSLALASLLAVPAIEGASTGTAHHYPSGSGGGAAQGDYISSTGGLDSPFRYFVEVTPGLSQLQVDIFDADVGMGGGGENAARRDRARGAFNTTAVYTLIDPNGMTRAVLTGNAAGPAGSDNAWTTLFNGTSFFLDQFGAASYANNDGNLPWSANWIETNDDNNPAAGVILITGGELRIRDNGGGASTIERQASLAGFTTATFSFNFR
ncbi:MAG TPA: hypothetical protein VIC87_19275, partial [Vicinamibacteria bacterium]